MQQIIKTIDRRRAHIKTTIEAGRAQMVRYFAARYSWGRACDPRRAYDWGIACAYLRHCQHEDIEPDYRAQWVWPSGNRGSVGGLIDVYHDGWELLHDLGLTDCDEFDPEPEEADPVAAVIVARTGVPADRLIVSTLEADTMDHVKQYRAKSGHIQLMPSDALLTEIIEGDNTAGFCLSCGETVEGIEPDAERDDCPHCGSAKVFGAENLMIRGLYFDADRAEDIARGRFA